jgi:ferredoxin
MSDDVFRKLQERLHQMPGSFPPTKSGVEIRLLKKLFAPDEAELFLELTDDPEDPATISARLGGDESELAARLEDMAVRGLVFRVREGDRRRYRALQFLVGIIDAQINRADAELADMIWEYLPQLTMARAAVRTKQMRIIPAAAVVDARTNVQPYNRLREMITDEDLIAVAPCMCRQVADAKGKNCDLPRETCLSFGEYAQYYMDNGVARKITKSELLELLELAEEKGLVINSANVKKVEIVCLCCSCHCNALRAFKILPQTDFIVNVHYQARIDPELCNACGTCLERCTIEAIKEGDETMEINPGKCIGCALCVTACPEEAIELVDKDTVATPFEDNETMMDQVAIQRGLK